ncbi:MAG: nitroreductase family protein [Chloroflexi bacterium]|nr:nitroreductase family protein [Chloroflexota bacterium]
MEVLQSMRTLRAVRRYRPEPVQDDVLRDILEAARWCGSGKNTQLWHFVVIRDRATLSELAQCGDFAGHLSRAPLAIAILTTSGPTTFQEFDSGRASQNMMLAAHARGVGACIAAIYAEHEARAKRLLDAPERYSLRVVLGLGVPAPREDDLTIGGRPREQVLAMVGRKPLAALVSYERFGQRPAEA